MYFIYPLFFFQDPDYYKKHGNYHRKVVAACIAWIICGCIVQYLVIFKLYDRHTDTLNSNFTVDAATKKNSMLLSAARDRAKERGSVDDLALRLSLPRRGSGNGSPWRRHGLLCGVAPPRSVLTPTSLYSCK